MKWVVVLVLLFQSLSIFAQDRNAFIYDGPQTSRMGAVDIISLNEIVNRYEQAQIPQKLWNEDNAGMKILGMSYRLSKTILLENVQDYLSGLVQHEVFGHGARLREFGDNDLTYHFRMFPPYGRGGGFTSWESSPTLTPDEDAVMRIGGMEAGDVLAKEICNRVLAHKKLNYREAALYIGSRLGNTRYALRTNSSDLTGYSSNDIASYIYLVGRRNPNVYLERIQAFSLLNLLDPLLLSSFSSCFYHYLYHGEVESGLPTISISNKDVLFGFHFSLSPFGYDYSLESFLLDSNNVTEITASLGSADNGMSVGIRIAADNLWANGSMTVGGRVQAWQQPKLFLSTDDIFDRDASQSLGGLIAIKASYWFAEHAGFLLEAGYKTRGYVAGDILDAGAIVRGGIVLGD